MIVGFEVVTKSDYPHASHNSALITSNITPEYLPLKLSTLPHKPSNNKIVLTGDGASSVQMIGH